MNSPSLSLDTLPSHCRAILHGLVTAFAGQGKTAQLKLLRAMNTRVNGGALIDAQQLAGTLLTLQQQGWLGFEQGPEGQFLCVPGARRNAVLLQLFNAPERMAWLHALQGNLPALGNWQLPSRSRVLQELWLDLLSGQTAALDRSLQRLDQSASLTDLHGLHPLSLLLEDSAGQQLFELLAADMRLLLLEDYLDLCNQHLMPASRAYQMALEQLGEPEPNSELDVQLLLQAFWRGDWAALERLGQQGLSVLRKVIELVLRGQTQPALELIQNWIALLRKQTKKRKVNLPPVLNALYCLAMIGSHDPQHYPQLKQALTLGLQEGYGQAYSSLYRLYEQLQGNIQQGQLLYLPTTLNGLNGLLHALGLYWLDEPLTRQDAWKNRLRDYRQQLSEQGYAWLAAEFDALLAAQFGLPRELAEVHQGAGLQPLVTLYQRQESWQHALTALSLLKPGRAATGSSAAKTSRLAWFIDFGTYLDKVEPREQKLGAKGQWSKGRAVALKRLMEESDSMDFLCEQDRMAIRMIQSSAAYYGSTHYELPAEQALPRLVGHPALYWSDAPDVRIDLQSGQPSLRLQVQGEQITLHLEPAGIGDQDGLMLHKETPTRLVIYPVSRDVQQIANIVGDGLSVPQSAKAQLVEAIGAIAPLLPIHSDIPELAGHLETLPADATLYAHLLPLEAGLRLQLLVRPLAEGSWFRPGQGAENLLGEQDGKAVQVCRDLAGERQSLQQVLQSCPGLARAEGDGQEWQLEQTQDALQVLSELHALDQAQLQCVWPEGERMRIKAKTGLGQLKLGLKQQGDWFMLQGEIQLDDGRVLQLRQLLELLKASPGRFLKLDEHDWLALSDSLRKRLDELASLADKVTDQGARL
ncbi:MAG TPA: ATP-dependent helicase, partial [Pseudomonas sp.]|nr:ATP-dependent helicase [Pseudomonas sp.]